MARSSYSYEKRQRELQKKRKKEAKRRRKLGLPPDTPADGSPPSPPTGSSDTSV